MNCVASMICCDNVEMVCPSSHLVSSTVSDVVVVEWKHKKANISSLYWLHHRKIRFYK